jgi:hypothetical protein
VHGPVPITGRRMRRGVSESGWDGSGGNFNAGAVFNYGLRAFAAASLRCGLTTSYTGVAAGRR